MEREVRKLQEKQHTGNKKEEVCLSNAIENLTKVLDFTVRAGCRRGEVPKCRGARRRGPPLISRLSGLSGFSGLPGHVDIGFRLGTAAIEDVCLSNAIASLAEV